MSLVVSLRVPDGIVIAADSLSTAQNTLEFIAEGIEIECPNCKKKLSCGCQRTKASDGKVVCKSWKGSYERSLKANTTNSTSNIKNL